MSAHASPLRQSAGWLILVALAALLYLYGLDSFYAPTNGDEMVYIHIARMTAESGNWLPLQSEIIDTRNAVGLIEYVKHMMLRG